MRLCAISERNVPSKVISIIVENVMVKMKRERISSEWLKQEMNECIFNLKETAFKVWTIISDDHSATAGAFSLILKTCNGD